MWDNELILQRELADISTDRLRTMLNAEIQKDVPDDDLVLTILHILEDREPEIPESRSEKEKVAWKLYQKRIRSRKKSKLPHAGRILRAAVAVLAVCLLFALVPQQVEADNWWNRLTRWTDGFFGFFREEEEPFRMEEYIFRTGNPGLQEVYNMVVEMGVTTPVVPMWLPEGYEIVECNTVATPVKQYVYARFLNDGSECTLKINLLNTEADKDYFKNSTDLKEIERGGTVHNLVQNEGAWIVSWTKDNIECSVFIDCSEDSLQKIIDSIYRWRMNE